MYGIQDLGTKSKAGLSGHREARPNGFSAELSDLLVIGKICTSFLEPGTAGHGVKQRGRLDEVEA